MISMLDLMLFWGTAVIMVLTPGPNMIYLVSRSICQGRSAGVISLLGVVAGFLVHLFAAACGLSAIFLTVPIAYETLKWVGALYLLWLAWQAMRPGARSPLAPQPRPIERPTQLMLMGFWTNVLNPKVAVFYLSILPQFISPNGGSVFAQSMLLGLTQIAISFSVNLLIALSASSIASWFIARPGWVTVQRWLMGSVLAALAMKLALQKQHAA